MKSLSLIKAQLPLVLLLTTMITHSYAASDESSQNLAQGLIIDQHLLVKPVNTVKSLVYPRYSTDLQQAIDAATAHPKDAKQQQILVVFKSVSGAQKKLIKQLKKHGAQIQSSMVADTVMAVVTPKTLKRMAKSALIATATTQPVVYAAAAETTMTQAKVAAPSSQEAINALTSTEVTLNLLKRAANSQPNTSENIIFSPWSMIEATTAVMLANDDKKPITRPNWLFPTATQQQWLAAYGKRAASKNFKSNNYLWLQKRVSVLPSFKTNYKKQLAGHIEALDFDKATESTKHINQQIAKDTEQKITQLLSVSDLASKPLSILTNAVYFKATWQNAFLKDATTQADFHNANGQPAKVAMMNQTQSYKWASVDNWTLLEMPFNANAPENLWLILPPAETPLALPNMETLTKLEAALVQEKIILSLPKIKLIAKRMELTEGILPEMAKWQLNQLIEGQSLPVAKAVHIATIEWDEVGATAAAATAVFISKSISLDSPRELKFNRPFVFMIKQQENTLFAGQIRQLP